ncbi:ATP-dependent DNA ligase Cdc17 [Coemansia erecta]|uniref:DNA ligase 1 n=1 Tax=Coemansia asiatica TaxID=1052880 RepID=A0A9W7XLQ4_9FUNG|nr:ATP-dependent DNA ligase Cdc17 [Coemansia asiatica]KAJ2857321.1 ATP-dependent DNA ligase Cdc17 [Coemansia erecta]
MAKAKANVNANAKASDKKTSNNPEEDSSTDGNGADGNSSAATATKAAINNKLDEHGTKISENDEIKMHGIEESAKDEEDAESIDAKTAKLEIKVDAKQMAAGGKKRRVLDSDDEGESTELSDQIDEESVTDLSDTEAQAEVEEDGYEEMVTSKAAAKSAASDVKKRGKASKLAKPAAKKAKRPTIEINKLDPIELIDTKEGRRIPFLALCKIFESIEATTKRLEITALIRDFLSQVMELDKEELTVTVMLCINKIAPDHEGIELGIGESILIKSIASATGRQVQKVKQEQQELGDLGMVVQRGKSNQNTMFKPKPLSISKVFSTFKEIATTSGSNSIQKKTGLITGLLASCSDIESKYLISLEAEDFQQATENLKQVLSEFPVYTNVIDSIYKYGISDVVNHCMLTPTLPVKPMLAKIEKAADDILRRFEGKPFTCEFKYDGERSQIHFVRKDENVQCVIFSRNAENNTNKYPDIANSVKEFAGSNVTSFILDCEAVAWDKTTGKIRSFQTLSSRKRKVENEAEITVGVCCFAFDLLYLNGEPLIRMPLRKRRELLHENFIPVQNKFQFAISKDLTEVEDIQEFLDLSIQENCEGLMIKTLDGPTSSYEPSKRSMNWLKLKKDYVEGLGDSLDLVVIGAYFGKGKRVGAYGAYLLACYDPDREEYQAICKIGTGFSDSDLESHKVKLDECKIVAPKPYYAFSDKTKPDIWFEPAMVWEVKAADLSLSPIYQAAFGEIDASKGVSLRFPRFIRVREDKTPEMATSSAQVAEMYENQKINQ